MDKLQRSELMPLERYAVARSEFRARVMAHKRLRRVPLGPHATLHFEDRLTIQYQIQEMLRAERIFESEEISAELDAYNPLIPDGSNWKATFMIEYEDPVERKAALERLKGIESKVWMQVDSFPRVWPVADEDMVRENEDKTAAVHFLRFDLSHAMQAAVRGGAGVSCGIEHSEYSVGQIHLPAPVRDALAEDLV